MKKDKNENVKKLFTSFNQEIKEKFNESNSLLQKTMKCSCREVFFLTWAQFFEMVTKGPSYF